MLPSSRFELLLNLNILFGVSHFLDKKTIKLKLLTTTNRKFISGEGHLHKKNFYRSIDLQMYLVQFSTVCYIVSIVD